MKFLSIFIFCFLGAALAIGIVGICKINPVKTQEKSETEVIKNGLAKKESDESRCN